MPYNLLKQYNELLDLLSLSPIERNRSLRGVFDRDFVRTSQPRFQGKPIYPCPEDGAVSMDTLFNHLITVMVDKTTRRREFEMKRSMRLHWAKFHLDQRKNDDMLIFSVREPEGFRTYIYDQIEKYVVVLEPLRKGDAYYLLSAHYVEGKDEERDKFSRKWKRKLPEVL